MNLYFKLLQFQWAFTSATHSRNRQVITGYIGNLYIVPARICKVQQLWFIPILSPLLPKVSAKEITEKLTTNL